MIYYIDMGTTNIRVYNSVSPECIYSGSEGVLNFQCKDKFDRLKFNIFLEEKLKITNSKIFVSGMLGSNIGLIEVDYEKIDIYQELKIKDLKKIQLNSNSIYIFPGVACETDIMRGEEIELLGVLSKHNISDYEFILFPGTHSKLVKIEEGVVKEFKTIFTGELISLLINNSTLFTNCRTKLSEIDYRSLHPIHESLLGSLFNCRSSQILQSKTELEALEYLLCLIYTQETSLLKGKTLIVCDETRKLFYKQFGTYNYETRIMSWEGFRYFYENNANYFSAF